MSYLNRDSRPAPSLEDILTFLLETHIFERLNGRELAEVVRIVQIRPFREGRVVFREGDVADAWYVVYEGEVSVTRGGENVAFREIASLGPRACFGEMAILDRQPRSATVIARTDSVIFRFPRDDFETLLEQGDLGAYKLVFEFARVLSERQRLQNEKLVELLAEREIATHLHGGSR